ncbi:MAG: hypothetical protein ACRC4L_03015, partial [Mycoplasma sp.]
MSQKINKPIILDESWNTNRNAYRTLNKEEMNELVLKTGGVDSIHWDHISNTPARIKNSINWFIKRFEEGNKDSAIIIAELYSLQKDFHNQAMWLEKLFESGDIQIINKIIRAYSM